MALTDTLTDFQALWLTLYGEARGEPIESIIGVANVIRNRHGENGHTIKDICLAPAQFSCWNLNDPNRAKLEALITVSTFNPIIVQLQYIAQGIIGNHLLDNTKGANHYLETNLYRGNNCPTWAKTANYLVTLGHHTFVWCK